MRTLIRGPRHSLFTGVRKLGREPVVSAAALLAAWIAGFALASGGWHARLVLLAGLAAAAAPVIWWVTRGHLPRDVMAIELPALLILLSELVFRQRDAASLAGDPLDTAGLYRVACIAAALLLGCLALTSRITRVDGRITTRPFRWYCGYVAVVFVGAPLSVNLPLTAYRGVELAVCVIAVAGAYRRAGREAMLRMLALIYWFTAITAILIWIEAVLMPGTAFTTVSDSPFPIQLRGVLPSFSANGVGTIGALLALWSLARILSPKDRGGASVRTLAFLGFVGFATLLFAQYRTGYVIAVVGLMVLLSLRAKAAAFWVLILGSVVAILWGAQITHEAVPVLERGANLDTVRSLSGRLNYWSHALPVWQESPLFGRGLLTASRYEVLAELGSVYTSSIHGTWVEALVGTGLLGVVLLGSSVVTTGVRAFMAAIRPDGRVVPFLLVTILLVRSITGPTFEVAGDASIMLLALMLLLRDRTERTQAHPAATSPVTAA